MKPLTPRQTQVMLHVTYGLDVDESAALLGISKWTVKTYRTTILRSLHARSMAHAVAIWMSEHAETEARSELLRAIESETRRAG